LNLQENPFTEDQIADLENNDRDLNIPVGTSGRQIMQESRNNAHAVSPAGAVGFAQVMPKTLASLNKQLGRDLDPTNWQDSLLIQKTVMQQNLAHFGNLPDALSAYNGGWDKSKWNNTETQGYAPAILGGVAPADQGGINFKTPHTQTKLEAANALESNAQDVLRYNAGAANGTAMSRPDLNTSLYTQAADTSAREVAQETQHASMLGTLQQGLEWNTITGRMVDHFFEDKADPNFKLTDDDKKNFSQQHPQIWANEEMRNYVLGASSQSNLESRLDAANQHVDFQQRYENTHGLIGAGDGLVNLMSGMADPVTLVATMGLGSALSVMKTGAEASMLARTAGSVAEGATTNVALGGIMADMDNQHFGWKDVVSQATAGAAFGLIGGLVHTKSKLSEKDPGVKPDGVDHAAAGAEHTANQVIDSLTAKNNIETPGLEGHNAGTVDPHAAATEHVQTGTEASGHQGHVDSAVERAAADEERAKADEEKAKATEQANASGDEEAKAKAAADEDTEAGRTVAPGVEQAVTEEWRQTWGSTRTGERAHDSRVAKATWVSDSVTELKKLTNSANEGIAKLAAHLLNFVRDPAAIYGQPLDKHGQPIRSNYTIARHSIMIGEDTSGDPLAKKPNGMTNDQTMLHEITHSLTAGKIEYGLAHPDTVHGQLVLQFNKLRQAALRQLNKEGKLAESKPGYDEQAAVHAEHHTRYYLTNAHEFSAGLFSGHDHFLQLLKRTEVGKGTNLLGKAVDIIRSLLGMEPDEVNGLTRAMGIHDAILERKLDIKQKIAIRGKEDGMTTHTVQPGRDVFLEPGHDREDIPLGPLAQSIEPQLTTMAQKPMPKELEAMRTRAKQWYQNWRGKTGIGRALGLLDSVGVKLGLSDNPMVRAVSNMMIEDATGASRAGGTSAAIDKVAMASNWRTPMANLWNQLSPELMTAKEKALVQAGMGDETLKRIGKQVQEERLQHRNARLNGTEYESQAHPAIQKLAAAMDGMFKDITEKGTAAGEGASTKIGKSGWQGYVPYRFDDAALRTLYKEALTDPAKAEEWNSLRQNFRDQYVQKLTDPLRAKMSKAGPVEERTLMQRVEQMAKDRTDDYFTQIMRDQGGRVLGADDHFANVAAKMLDDVRALNGRKATRLTKQLISDFRKDLIATMSDKSRTEFDLLKEVGGKRMLDYLDTDYGRMVQQNTSHYAGAISLAKRGIKDDTHWQAFKDVLTKHGASNEELDNLEFAYKSLKDEHHVTENAAAQALQSATSLALMGKVGLNGLGDAGALVGAVGMKGFLGAFVNSFGKDTALMAQLKVCATSALGMDHRIHMAESTSGITPHTGSMLTNPTMWKNIRQGLNTSLSWMSLSRPIQMMTHRAAVPAITEELVKAIQGTKFDEHGTIVSTGSKTLTPARLVETGLDADRVRGIQTMLAEHDAGRQVGDQINWHLWDKAAPGTAEDMIGAIHRVTGQVLQRAFIGEQPRWQVETAMGKFFTQFRNQGMVGAEKQVARNMAHADRTAVVTGISNAAWAAGLYYAKTMASTAGMSDAQRDKYLAHKFSGIELASGVSSMTNISGIASDALDATNMVFGGQSNGTSPFASMGYLKTAAGAISKIGGQISGSDTADIHKTVAATLRTVPLGNTFLGTALVNGVTP
jgi:hypothetical protein